MTQTEIDFSPRKEQDLQIKRVHSRLGTEVLFFCKTRMAKRQPEFHMDDLRKYLTERQIVFAPASPDRILRELRRLNVVNYRVKNRRQSLYEVVGTLFSK